MKFSSTQLKIKPLQQFFFSLLILFLPTQLGKHFWPAFSSVLGIRIDYLSPTLFLTDILVLCLFVMWVLKRFSRRLLRPQNKTKQRWIVPGLLLLLLLNSTIGIWGSSLPLLSLYGVIKWIEWGFVAYMTTRFVNSKVRFERFATFFAYALFGQSILAIVQFILQHSVGGLFYFVGERTFTGDTPGIANASLHGTLVLRPYATFPHPNVLAGYLVLGMTILLCTIKMNRSIKTIGYVSALLTGTIALCITFSRIAIIVWVGCVAYFMYSKLRHKRLDIRSILLSVGSILLLLTSAFLYAPLRARFVQFSFTEESLVVREKLTRATVFMIHDHPFFGVGIYQFLRVLPPYIHVTSLQYLQPVHSIYLYLLAEIGFVGLSILCVFFFFTWKHASKVPRLLLVIVLFLGLFDHYFVTLQQGQLLSAVIIGLCWSTYRPNISAR